MLASTLRPPSCQHGGRSHAAEVLACLPTGLPLGLDELGRSRDRTGRGGSRIVVSAHQRPHTPPMEALPQDPAQSAWPPPDFRLTHAPSHRARRGGDLGRGTQRRHRGSVVAACEQEPSNAGLEEEGTIVPLVLDEPSPSHLNASVPTVTKKTHRTMSGAQEVLNEDSQTAVLVISGKHAWEHHLPCGQGLGFDTQVDLGHVALGLLRPCTAPGHPARTPGGNKDKHSCQQCLVPCRTLEEGKFHEESKPHLGHVNHLEGMSLC